MSNLSREEIVLLNCFNYLNIRDWRGRKLGKVINNILRNPNEFKKLTVDKPASMGGENWKHVLKRIQNNGKLCSLTIASQSQMMGYNTQGLNAICLLDHESQKATFVFRGTGRGEWLDNGVAFSEPDSPQQLEALEYFERAVNELELKEEGYVIDVTGHSKGGNKAQFITMHSDIVNECYSFDGQGFSKEALEKYKDKIQQNHHKIISIAADKDYVHCLGNEIAGKKELFKTKHNMLEFPYNHCPDAILKENGLTEKVHKEPWQNIMINRYSKHLMELGTVMKKEIFSSFMGLAQITLSKSPAIENRVPSYNDAKNALSKASVEFKNWFRQDRNRFTIGQKIVLSALGVPIIKLGVPFIYNKKYESFEKLEKQVFGSLSEDIKKEFGDSKDGMLLQKVLEFSKKDLEKIHKLILENGEREIDHTPSKEKEKMLENEIERDIFPELETKQAADKLSHMDTQQKILKRELFCHLKNRNDLIEIIDTVKDTRVKYFCEEKLKEIKGDMDTCLESLNKNIRINGNIKNLVLDDMNKYLIKKINSKINTTQIDFVKDNIMEESINLVNEKIMLNVGEGLKNSIENKLINIDKLAKAHEISKFCNITIIIEKKRFMIKEARIQIDKIKSYMMQIEHKKEVLSKVKSSLENRDKYKDIAQKYDKKRLFKKSYQNKFQGEKDTYDRAQNYLRSVRISSWEEFNSIRKEFDKSKSSLETISNKKSKLESIRHDLYNDMVKQKNVQKSMIKQRSTASITQGQVKSRISKKQMER